MEGSFSKIFAKWEPNIVYISEDRVVNISFSWSVKLKRHFSNFTQFQEYLRSFKLLYKSFCGPFFAESATKRFIGINGSRTKSQIQSEYKMSLEQLHHVLELNRKTQKTPFKFNSIYVLTLILTQLQSHEQHVIRYFIKISHNVIIFQRIDLCFFSAAFQLAI